ncbi:MAG: MCE family protein, partial [Gammaproteobacteria bacterium]|nr:MCE family protein [Gammaproteobacteria bacterium]
GQGASQRHFIGLEAPPVVKAEEAGKKIVLLAKKLGSIDTGSPIYYQGITAGEVLGYELGNDRKSVFIHAFIKSPYDEFVQGNSRFWNVSGVDISVGASGFDVRTESIQSLLFGGIAFDTPDALAQVKEDVEGLVFTLYDDLKSIQEQSFTRKVKFVLFFKGSVRGLAIGAPVEFRGIKVGSVVDVRLKFNRKDTSFLIPVVIEFEPERVIEDVEGVTPTPYEFLKTLVDRGLRARLQTGNLLTGQLYVELDMHPDTPIRLVLEGGAFPELPTIQASMAEITASIKGVLAKLEKVDLEQIGAELLETLQGTNKLFNAPQLQDALDDLQGSLGLFRGFLDRLDRRVEPIAVNVESAIGAGHQAFEKAQITLSLLDDVLQPDMPLQFSFIQMTEELAEMARSIRTLVDGLDRNPESVRFGKTPPGGR